MHLFSILVKKGLSVTKKDEAPELIQRDIDLGTRLVLPMEASCMSEMFPGVLNLQKELQCTSALSRQEGSQCAGGLGSSEEHNGTFSSNQVDPLLARPFVCCEGGIGFLFCGIIYSILYFPGSACIFGLGPSFSSITDTAVTALHALNTLVLRHFEKVSLKINTILR